MRTVITAQGFDPSDALRASIRNEIGRLVQSLRRPVNMVAVHLVDAHGYAVRGLDKLCRVHVEFGDDNAAVGDAVAESDFDESVTEAFVRVLRAAPRARTR